MVSPPLPAQHTLTHCATACALRPSPGASTPCEWGLGWRALAPSLSLAPLPRARTPLTPPLLPLPPLSPPLSPTQSGKKGGASKPAAAAAPAAKSAGGGKPAASAKPAKAGGAAAAAATPKEPADKNILFPARKKNFRIGNDVQPVRDLSRFVKWPRYVRLQRQKKVLYDRLKVPPSINQFSHPLDRAEAQPLFALLVSGAPAWAAAA